MKAVILCDGKPPRLNQLKDQISDHVLLIAADGGTRIAQQFNLIPNVIVGDFDSYRPTGNEEAEMIHDPGQETNDLEKALSIALQKGAEEVIVFGATGKRLDHTLKNLSVLKQFDSKFKSLIFKDTYSDILLIQSPFRTELPEGTSVSLFPLSGKVEGITTKGLLYPLHNETLQNGVRDGSSNRTVKKEVEIEFKKGDLLLFINH
ncbi:MAG: thiamine diphosphokinase [Balneolaceae bacterium]|nr:MAG: thiamine diphosphokinase [Balneolaceae bacterium]